MVVTSPFGKILRREKGESLLELSRRQTAEFIKEKLKEERKLEKEERKIAKKIPKKISKIKFPKFRLPKLRRQPKRKALKKVKTLTPKQVGAILAARIARRKERGI